MYDVVITGSGPAGLSAALYLKRAGKHVLIIEKEYEGTGQIAGSVCVENYLGFPCVKGEVLGEKFKQHVVFAQVPFLEDEVTEIFRGGHWRILLASGREIETKSICAYCDGSLYKNKDVAVIGGGIHTVFVENNNWEAFNLAIHPASTISLHSTQRQKEDAGVYDDLVRVSVGIEDIDDLIEDFRRAIEITIKQ